MTEQYAAIDQPVPRFSLPASSGQTLGLQSFLGKVPLALVFINDVDSDEGGQLLEQLDTRLVDFGAERAQLLGIVKETARRVREIAESKSLSLAVLADASGATARDFGVTGEGVATAVIVDRDGVLRRRYETFPDGDQMDVAIDSLLYAVRALGTGHLTADKVEDIPGEPLQTVEESDFLATVSERANLPATDAKSLVTDFLRALAGRMNQEVWSELLLALPVEADEIEWDEHPRSEIKVEDTLIGLSRRESLETDRAADHARAVAETITDGLSDVGRQRLAAAIADEDILALFERTRGEFTSADR